MSINVVILQLVVLLVVLESDVGRRKIGWLRVLRPVVTIAFIVPFYFTSLPTSGPDLLLQGIGLAVGAALGLISMCPWFVSVWFEPAHPDRSWVRRAPAEMSPASMSRAGTWYAVIWIGVTVARLAFAYGSEHLFGGGLGRFLAAHALSGVALANAFIFLSVGMDFFRSVSLLQRARTARIRFDRQGAGSVAVPALTAGL